MKMVLTKELEVNKTSVKFRQKQKKRRLKYSRCLFFCHSNQGSNVLHMVDLPSTWGRISTLLREDKHVLKESLLCFYPNKLKTILIYTMTYHRFFFFPQSFQVYLLNLSWIYYFLLKMIPFKCPGLWAPNFHWTAYNATKNEHPRFLEIIIFLFKE